MQEFHSVQTYAVIVNASCFRPPQNDSRYWLVVARRKHKTDDNHDEMHNIVNEFSRNCYTLTQGAKSGYDYRRGFVHGINNSRTDLRQGINELNQYMGDSATFISTPKYCFTLAIQQRRN